MSGLINIGFGNMVNTGKVVAIINPDSAPVKRMIQSAKDSGMAIDATQGRRTRSVIVTGDGYLLLSALQAETITGRFENKSIYVHTKGEDDE